MSFKKTYALIRGSWDGTPGSSNFTQDATVFATPAEFFSYVDQDLTDLVGEHVASGHVIQRGSELSADGKVLIFTTECVDEAGHDEYFADARWASEKSAVKYYDVQQAVAPEDVGVFDEEGGVYFHTTAHVF